MCRCLTNKRFSFASLNVEHNLIKEVPRALLSHVVLKEYGELWVNSACVWREFKCHKQAVSARKSNTCCGVAKLPPADAGN